MYQLALCDDESETRYFIGRELTAAFEKADTSVSMEYFSDGQRFLNTFDEHHHFDVVFMDIEMPGMDGMEVCRKLRSMSAECIIVFISSKDELVFQSFEVQPFRFVRKTEFQTLCPRLVADLAKELSRRTRRLIQFTEPGSGSIYSFEIAQILYVEAQRKQTKIVTQKDAVPITVKLTDVEEQLQNYAFLKPHRSYLVNCEHISIIQKESILMKNGDAIPISRNRLDAVRADFIRYASEGGI